MTIDMLVSLPSARCGLEVCWKSAENFCALRTSRVETVLGFPRRYADLQSLEGKLIGRGIANKCKLVY